MRPPNQLLLLCSFAAAELAPPLADKCPGDESCTSIGNWVDLSLEYAQDTGKFSGMIATNQCPQHDQASARGDSTCKTVGIGEVMDNLPHLGMIGLSRKGVNVYNAFEAGFGDKSVTLANSQVTTNGRPPYPCYNEAAKKFYGGCDKGVDVKTCEESLKVLCEPADIMSPLFMDRCGGHAQPYHYHTDLICYYDHAAAGHSPLVGFGLDGHGLYGLHESTGTAPTGLDACNGHTGPVPADSELGVAGGSSVYHYHTTTDFPFTLGCYGPKTFAECMKDDSACGSGAVRIKNPDGSDRVVDDFCACRGQPTDESKLPDPASGPSDVGSGGGGGGCSTPGDSGTASSPPNGANQNGGSPPNGAPPPTGAGPNGGRPPAGAPPPNGAGQNGGSPPNGASPQNGAGPDGGSPPNGASPPTGAGQNGGGGPNAGASDCGGPPGAGGQVDTREPPGAGGQVETVDPLPAKGEPTPDLHEADPASDALSAFGAGYMRSAAVGAAVAAALALQGTC